MRTQWTTSLVGTRREMSSTEPVEGERIVTTSRIGHRLAYLLLKTRANVLCCQELCRVHWEGGRTKTVSHWWFFNSQQSVTFSVSHTINILTFDHFMHSSLVCAFPPTLSNQSRILCHIRCIQAKNIVGTFRTFAPWCLEAKKKSSSMMSSPMQETLNRPKSSHILPEKAHMIISPNRNCSWICTLPAANVLSLC